jgi:hypothetical protein
VLPKRIKKQDKSVKPPHQKTSSQLNHDIDIDIAQQHPLTAAQILTLQRRIGNRAVCRMIARKREEKDNPTAIQEQLGEGKTLETGVRSHMESAFGTSFSHVRMHTDADAAQMANSLDAQAFAVGNHIAFGEQEYQPGTPVGDALIAHELAHVAQQRNATPGVAYKKNEEQHYNTTLERDADSSAFAAVLSLWGGTKDIASQAMPRLQSGLSLRRCSKKDKNTIKEAKGILDTIPTGKKALAIRKKYDVKVVANDAGSGSAFDSAKNKVGIDRSENAQTAALTFIHEMNHAQQFHKGESADVENLGRAEYVNKELEEETEGTVRSIEGKMELRANKVDVSKAETALETEFLEAYNKAIAAHKITNPKATEGDLYTVGRAAGWKRVREAFGDGTVVTSTTQETYEDYYGDYWDTVHNV